MTHEEQTKLLAEARWALAQSLRQWSRYANDQRCEPDDVDLGNDETLESRFYSRAMSALEGLGAVADELERAPIARKTAFDSSAWFGASFDDWMDAASPKSVARLWNSVRWRWWRQWPIRAMRAGWKAREAVLRLERRRSNRKAPNDPS